MKSSDEKSLSRQNSLCASEIEAEQLETILTAVEAEILKFETTRHNLYKWAAYLSRYTAALRGSEGSEGDPPWSSYMEFTLGLLRRLQGQSGYLEVIEEFLERVSRWEN